MEAGGHRVSFLRPAEESLVGTFALVPQVVDAVDVPVIAAGGIADARGVAAALVLGASGALIGTAFLATDQSGASAAHRDVLRSDAGPRDRADPGAERAAGPRHPEPCDAGDHRSGALPPAELAHRALPRPRRRARPRELLSLWAGQAAALGRQRDAAALLRELARACDALLPA